MLKAYKEYWKGYVDFRGQTSVGGYWWAVLANYIVTFALSLFSNLININRPESGMAFSLAFMLLCLLPSLAIMVRRLRDAGYKWTNIFWVFLPIAGFIILIVRLCKPSSGTSYKPVTQQVSASGAPVYQTYSQPPAKPVPTATAPAAKPVPAAGTSILDQYKAGLSYLDGCGAFDESKFREFNRITGNRFSEKDMQNQLSSAKLMIGGMDALRNTLRSTMLEAVHSFEALERSGIDLSKYNI
ncbi:MAG: DUF805 domain-containing protein [Christensenellaceae bacterium]|jgi:uncharacterized membrane protein YhaH (DUF805 family)|nr:DUF805 domain-containing protein [Christensenellaceae bacterium]